MFKQFICLIHKTFKIMLQEKADSSVNSQGFFFNEGAAAGWKSCTSFVGPLFSI